MALYNHYSTLGVPPSNHEQDSIESTSSSTPRVGVEPHEASLSHNKLAAEVKNRIRGRLFSRIGNGCFGMEPEESIQVDSITVVRGSNIPVVIRRATTEDLEYFQGLNGNSVWKLVGIAYIHGVMDGEVWESGWKELLTEDAICLI